ncbi:MAG: hypothetical protein QHJ73_17090, partial [Armatimonadota bacterium]|nr:hypothetical protein [Armatimonadota bacterium]
PFFPLGWYFGPGPTAPEYRTHLDRVAASPFNTIMCYGINAGDLQRVRTYLDELHRRKLKILYSIKDVYEGTRYYQESVLGFRGEDAIVKGVVGAFRTHPAVLGWYLNDELPLSMRDRLEARYEQVRRLDPDHPTWAVLYQVGDLRGYLGTADVLGTDPYPVGRAPITMVADWTRRSSEASGGFRPLWQVPQAHDWACYDARNADKLRAPTLDEEMVMSYLCLIHGAHGLVFYSYQDLLRDRLGFDRRWADMLVVGNEIKQLFPALLSTAPAPRLTVQRAGGDLHLTLRADAAGNYYVLMANPDPDRGATAHVTVPAGMSAELLRHAVRRHMPRPADGRVQVALPPMGAATLILKR